MKNDFIKGPGYDNQEIGDRRLTNNRLTKETDS
jgi:hypothetical protein